MVQPSRNVPTSSVTLRMPVACRYSAMPALILRDPASNFAACRFRPESEFLFHLLSEDGRVLEFKSVEAVLEAGWRLVTTARAKESPLRNSPPLQSRWDARPS